jgi:hypothetical protein
MALVLPPHAVHACPAKIIMHARTAWYMAETDQTDHQFSHHLKLINSATAPKLISRSMSLLLANMVLSFCKTIQEYSSAGVLGCFFGAAHTPVRFGRPIVARTTAVSSSVRTMEHPTVCSPRPAPRWHDLSSTRRLLRPPLGLHDLSSTLARRECRRANHPHAAFQPPYPRPHLPVPCPTRHHHRSRSKLKP